ncbi:MAG TPA: DivIVA domain-containing protein [Microlunatus sp.]
MTLSLDDVRNKRFRMARKSGYEVLEVDEFVDEVEVAFEQLAEENQNLKKQIDALTASPAVDEAAPAAADSGPAEPETIVVTTGAEASSAVVRLVTLSTEQAERLVEEATAEAAQIREAASTSAQEVTGEAQAQADRIAAEAQQTAERVQAEAKDRADNLDSEIAGRRSELLDALHAERDDLQLAVGQLRGFEASFRANLTNELREHITSLESRTAQPYEVPALADPAAVAEAQGRAADAGDTETSGGAGAGAGDEAADADASEAAVPSSTSDPVFPDEDPADEADGPSTSDTPRLDALLGDQR